MTTSVATRSQILMATHASVDDGKSTLVCRFL